MLADFLSCVLIFNPEIRFYDGKRADRAGYPLARILAADEPRQFNCEGVRNNAMWVIVEVTWIFDRFALCKNGPRVRANNFLHLHSLTS